MSVSISDARILLHLLRGLPQGGSHAARLQAFYGPQAAAYDDFRERLLHGRRELMESLDLRPGEHLVELGAGTGRNLRFLDGSVETLGSVTLVDLCPALLEQARAHTAAQANVHVVEADAARWRPPHPVDAVLLSYALTMIPDWQGAITNALAMLRPGGRLGVVDFYISAPCPDPGLARHGALARRFWPRWFRHDGVHLNPAHMQMLRDVLPDHRLVEDLAPLPYLPGLRVPFYRFVGRKPSDSSTP
jgi:S-adenosylmethionine-diacylgycerolhomoserine-N-methlytransferase